MPRGDILSDVFLNICYSKGLNAKAAIVLARSCRQAKAERAEALECCRLLSASVSEKEAEMRVMRVGRTIDRAVWLAKRGGECQKLDPETMAGIQPLHIQNLCCCVL